MEVSLIPVLLGDGIPLLPPPYNKVPLKLTSQKVLADNRHLDRSSTEILPRGRSRKPRTRARG